MEFHRFGDDTDPTVLFIMGWGNRVGHPTVEWFIERIVDAGFEVHAAEIPDNGADFQRDYLAPVTEYARDLDAFRLLSHSTGGLVAAHLPADGPRVYLSPFWGFNRHGLSGTLMQLLTWLPTDRQFLGSNIDGRHLGEHKDPEVVQNELPDPSPTWLRTMATAHDDLPAFREGSRVFCSLSDRIVDVRAIGDHAPANSITLFDGGHELFAVENRAVYTDQVITALRPRNRGTLGSRAN